MVELPASVVWSVGSGLVGALVALTVAHFVAGRAVSYMQGQLSALMDIHKRVEALGQRQAVQEQAHRDLATDVNRLGAKIRSGQAAPIRPA